MITLCKALIDAGVTNQTSKAGIDFCINSCPYPYCVVDEKGPRTRVTTTRRKRKERRARRMFSKGKSMIEIAAVLGVGVRTIRRYVRGK